MLREFSGGYKFGEPIVMKLNPEDGVYRAHYLDGSLADYGQPIPRPCPKCGLMPTPEGHDPCIANLPGVEYACCGHGVQDGYVKFTSGLVIRGRFDHLEGAP